MQLGDRDQHDDQRDAGQRCKNQLPAGSDGFWQFGVGRQDGKCGGHRFSCSVVRVADNAT